MQSQSTIFKIKTVECECSRGLQSFRIRSLIASKFKMINDCSCRLQSQSYIRLHDYQSHVRTSDKIISNKGTIFEK
jgi:hypothetical protein